MPTLAQMAANANAKSYYSRPSGEVWSALNEGGKRVYDAIVKENALYFRKVDTASVTLVNGTQTYALPSDVSQLIQVAERVLATDKWLRIDPADGDNDPSYVDAGFEDGLGISLDARSEFMYVGPYLSATSTQAAGQAQSIDIAPIPSDSRFVRLVYVAKWIEITASAQSLLLPTEGTYAMEAFGTAELLRSNGDSLADEYESKGEKMLAETLNLIRRRQLQQAPGIQPYL